MLSRSPALPSLSPAVCQLPVDFPAMEKCFSTPVLLTNVETHHVDRKAFKSQEKRGNHFLCESKGHVCDVCVEGGTSPNSLAHVTCRSPRRLGFHPEVQLLRKAETHMVAHTEAEVFLRLFH